MGALSAATCAVYFVPLVLRHAGGIVGLVIAGWNGILFVLWVAVFGVFGDVSGPSTAVTFSSSPSTIPLPLSPSPSLSLDPRGPLSSPGSVKSPPTLS